MRFLIDTTTAQLVRYGKFSRVTRMLASELGDGSGLLVNVLGGDIVPARNGLSDPSEFIPFWATMPWRSPVAFEDIQRAAKVVAEVVVPSLVAKPLPPESLRDLTWTFAKTFDFFPSGLRRRIGQTLAIETEDERRELFLHWAAERGAAYWPFTPLERDARQAITPKEGDALVLPGASWGHVDMNALGELRRGHRFSLVSLVYDVLPLDHPSLLPVHHYVVYRDFLTGVGQHADLIIAPNETTLHRLKEFFAEVGITADGRLQRHCLANAALRGDSGELSPRLQELQLERRAFLFCMSGLRARKHVLWLYALCARLRKERADFPLLVIAGTCDLPLIQILKADPDWEKVAIFLLDPTDSELAWLYRHTLASLYPSFEGGLGLSVTEAVGYGRPCIAADAAALVEASAGLAEHLPRDETLWAAAIARMSEAEQQPGPQSLPARSKTGGLLADIRLYLEDRPGRRQ
ncbi:MAG TPA: glycosyltransferase [Methylocystis sp.]|jgi:glycosyltransferase involved in cell wall biosynthesis